MDLLFVLLVVSVLLVALAAVAFEFRLRSPDTLVVYEKNGTLALRRSTFYPRHFSLLIKHTTHSIPLTIEATAAGNVGVNVKLSGTIIPAVDRIERLVRVGGWSSEALVRAAEEVSLRLEGLVKEYVEKSELRTLSATALSNFLNQHAACFKDMFGVEMIALVVQSIEPTDAEIADALRQQEHARLLEETERLNHQARVAAARARYRADEEIVAMEHALALKKLALQQELFEQENALARKKLEEELAHQRLRLAVEKEELDLLKNHPEVLLLTPQAARLAEASQGFKNARTVITLSSQDGTQLELFDWFQNLLRRALETRHSQ